MDDCPFPVLPFIKVLRNEMSKPMARIRNHSHSEFVILLAIAAALFLPTSLRATSPTSARSDSESFDAVAAKAQEAREAGRNDEAIQNYQAGVKMHSGWEEGWWYLGTLLYDSDHFAEAIPALRRVVELDGKVSAGWAFLGLCEFEIGDYSDALVHLQQASQLGLAENPEIEKPALYHLGVLLNQHGEFEQATDLLTSAFGSGPIPDQIKTALGLALLRVPLLPAQVDPAKDAIVHAAGETAALLSSRNLDAASRNFEQMLQDYPGTPYLHYQYGLALAAASQDDRAEAQLRAETLAFPRDGLPWTALAILKIRHKKFEEGVAAARQATQLSPHSAAAYHALAEGLQGQGRPTEAAAALQRASLMAKQPTDIDPAQIKRFALRRMNESTIPSAATHPSSQTVNVDETVRLANSARQSGRLDQAAGIYLHAVQIRPDWQEGWRQLGTIDYMRSRYAEAIPALQQSVALDSKQPDTWTLLGLCEFQTKDYKNARIHLERGRALGFSGNAAAVRFSRYYLACLRSFDGDFDDALDLLIPETGPGALSEEIRSAMGIALLRIRALPDQIDSAKMAVIRSAGEAAELLSRSYYDKAFQIFDQMLHESPETPFLHYAYGDALASASQYDAAQTQLREETRLNPMSELAYIRLASIELLLHQPATSLQDSQKAVSIAPESAEARYVLGRALLESGNLPDAIRELETARRLAPGSSKVHFNLARAYAQADRSTEAEQERTEFERLKGQSSVPNSFSNRSVSDAPPQPSAKQSAEPAH